MPNTRHDVYIHDFQCPPPFLACRAAEFRRYDKSQKMMRGQMPAARKHHNMRLPRPSSAALRCCRWASRVGRRFNRPIAPIFGTYLPRAFFLISPRDAEFTTPRAAHRGAISRHLPKEQAAAKAEAAHLFHARAEHRRAEDSLPRHMEFIAAHYFLLREASLTTMKRAMRAYA